MIVGTQSFARSLLATFALTAVFTACSAPVSAPESTAASESAVTGSEILEDMGPDSGPNIGGTDVYFTGHFSTIPGATQFLFGGKPGTNVRCSSDTHCVATSPPSDFWSTTEDVPVWAVVNGVMSSGPIKPFFTYDAGPGCKSQLTCDGIGFGFPDLIVTCAGPLKFYDFAGTPNETLVSTAASYRRSTNDVPHTLRVCDPGYYSYDENCTDFVVQGPANYCGTLPPPPQNLCQQCEANGGTCSTYKGKSVCIYD
jgi:hypothetical protein